MSDNDFKEVLIASFLLWMILWLLSGCATIEIEHRPGKTPKLSLESETLDKICTKDFDADIKTDSFVISCDVKL